MVNQGSPNPSALIVNLLEDARQADPDKLKVTAYPPGTSEGMQAFPGDASAPAGGSVEVAARTVPPGAVFHLSGLDAQADVDSAWELKVDGEVVAVGATSAAQPVIEKTFDPAFRLAEGQVVALHVANQGSVEGAFKAVLRGWDEGA